MLQIQHIRKEYRTGKLVQKALDDVSLNLRDNEFVAILGPSGSGKTTLLNIIGGLDQYDSGDLIINGISTKKYKDRDWDSYRNHTIGFVFQSYNLIPHQTLLSNVELALTISGISKSERKQRAREALEKVGLGEQVDKKPNQLSGGQMQRVAIARALVNDPDILLADEPTGALDSVTSVQVMDLLQEVAKDRLVVMVTHNPELAEEYATRIVNLKDGHILSDTDPFDVNVEKLEAPEHKNMGKSSMSFLTALSLSFNNLKTKKARTLLTSFAGSIGIIGIALILALSNGVNQYIKNTEEETLAEYPLQIRNTGLDLTSMLAGSGMIKTGDERNENDINIIQTMTSMFSQLDSNDLGALKAYLDSGESGIEPYVNAIEYSYNVQPQIYRQDENRNIRQVNPDQTFSSMGMGGASGNSMMTSMMSTNVFYPMPESEKMYKDQYDVKAGHWPESSNELVLVLTPGGSMTDFMMYTLGLRDSVELDDMLKQFMDGKDVEVPENLGRYTYDDVLGLKFKLISASDRYEYDSEYKIWKDKTENKEYMKQLVANGEDMEIVGIVQAKKDAKSTALSPGINYQSALIHHVVDMVKDSEIVKKQLENKKVNVFTNEKFGEEKKDEFDMNSLFEIDQDALADAFKMDTSAINGGFSNSFNIADAFQFDAGSLDLSGMVDFSNIHVTMPEMPAINMGDLLQSVKITASADDVNQLVSKLLSGYQDYASAHPEADYSNLVNNFMEYLQSEAAADILKRNIEEIMGVNGDVTVTPEMLQKLITDIMAQYQGYVISKGYDVSENFTKYLGEYLQTQDAKDYLNHWISENLHVNTDIKITQEQLQKMAAELAKGYGAYAVEKGYPDPSMMGQHFINYLGTEQAKTLLSDAITTMIDTTQLQAQIGSSIQNYMQEAFAAYGEAIGTAMQSQMATVMKQITDQLASGMQAVMTQMMSGIGNSLQNAMNIDGDAFANAFKFNMDADNLTELMMSMSSSKNSSYEGNLATLGYVDFAVPSGIDIYPIDFDSKEGVVQVLDDYNARMEDEGKEDKVITYTDMVGALMSSVTDIIDMISYVLIAFVAISLIVSSIMIGVITYISVLERQKEIGILRAIGASKGNISQVFNAETFIIGLLSGLMGIGLSLLILIPGNATIHYISGNESINAVLPALPAIILIILSVVLTVIGGLIPSRKAAKSDPVTALRTD